jgi:hypothetical protein
MRGLSWRKVPGSNRKSIGVTKIPEAGWALAVMLAF